MNYLFCQVKYLEHVCHWPNRCELSHAGIFQTSSTLQGPRVLTPYCPVNMEIRLNGICVLLNPISGFCVMDYLAPLFAFLPRERYKASDQHVATYLHYYKLNAKIALKIFVFKCVCIVILVCLVINASAILQSCWGKQAKVYFSGMGLTWFLCRCVAGVDCVLDNSRWGFGQIAVLLSVLCECLLEASWLTVS